MLPFRFASAFKEVENIGTDGSENDIVFESDKKRAKLTARNKFDILPRLKCVGFLDTNAWNPSISTAGITHALQFGNALPKNILGCKQITIIYRPTS